MNPADDPDVRAAVLASITEAEIRELAATSVLFLNVIADVILAPVFAECPSTLTEWEDVCGSRSGDLSVPSSERDRPFPRLVNEDRKSERNVGGKLYPRAICGACGQRAPVHVRTDSTLVFRSHKPCPERGDVDPARVVGWGTFEHLAPAAPVSDPRGMVSE